jgi:hypothetical protein
MAIVIRISGNSLGDACLSNTASSVLTTVAKVVQLL